jgi:hypothetical protein
LGKVLSFFIDPNFGIFPYMPVIFIIAIVSLLPSIMRRDTFVLELWITVILMAVIGSTSSQLNSGMMYIHRFSVWMIPLLVLIVIYSIRFYPRVKIRLILLIGFIISAGITSALLVNYDYLNYVHFNSVTNAIIIDMPCVYNPPIEVFIERMSGVDGANPDDYLPIIIAYNGRPRKMLTDSAHDEEIGEWIRAIGLGSYTINRLDDRFSYINFDNSLEDLIPASTDISAIYYNHGSDIIDTNISMFGIAGGWHSLEGWDGISTRWISEDASLFFVCQENTSCTLSLNAHSFCRNRILEVYAGDKLLTKALIPTYGFVEIEVPVYLVKGINVLRLRVPDGCERPRDMELTSSDARCLSVAIQNVALDKMNSDQLKSITGFYET